MEKSWSVVMDIALVRRCRRRRRAAVATRSSVASARLLDAAAAALRGLATAQLLAGAPAGHARILPCLPAAPCLARMPPVRCPGANEAPRCGDGGALSSHALDHRNGVCGGRSPGGQQHAGQLGRRETDGGGSDPIKAVRQYGDCIGYT